MAESFSSYGANRRRGTLHDDIDRSVYTVGQTLASVVNDPRTAHQTSGFWGFGSDATQKDQPPPIDPVRYPPVTKQDVEKYVGMVHGSYDRFVRDRQSLEAFDTPSEGPTNSGKW